MFTKQELNLIRELTLNEFRLKYKNSILGFFWSLLKPLSMFIILYIVFKVFIKINFENYALFLLMGIILWNFFAESTSFGLNSIVSKSGIVKKVKFRHEILIISACLTSLFSFLLNFIVFIVFLLIIKGSPSLLSVYIIVPILELFFISLGISFVIAILFVKYRDIGHIWEILLQIGFWISPIAYPTSIVPIKYINIYMLNPLAQIITTSRDLILNNYLPNISSISISLIMSFVILLLGYFIFKSKHKEVVEYL